VEVSIPSGALRTLIAGGISFYPDWAPSGKHFLFVNGTGEKFVIEDRQADGEGFSRLLGEVSGHSQEARWSPDGRRFLFYGIEEGIGTLRLANASGGGWVTLDSTRAGALRGFSWSPDGQWISYIRSIAGREDLTRIRATPGATPQIIRNAATYGLQSEWSPAGDWIAYLAADGVDLVSPDGRFKRNLTSHRFTSCGFTKDGSLLYGILHNPTGSRDQWQLYQLNVSSGAEKLVAPIDFPPSVQYLVGFSIHPDGKRFLTSIATLPSHIWMLEGFDQAEPKNWIARLLRR
jgi:dipeptidyl aminopeptidase/acylaminoacyl peptidase